MAQRSGLLRFLQRHILNPRRKQWRNRKLRLLIMQAEMASEDKQDRKPYEHKP